MRGLSTRAVGALVFALALTASTLAPNHDPVGIDFPVRGRGLPNCYVLTTRAGAVVRWSAKAWFKNAGHCLLLAAMAAGARHALGSGTPPAELDDEP